MGGQSSSEQTQQSVSNPWAPAQPALQGILKQVSGNLGNTGLTGAETGAINNVEQNYAPQIGNYTQSLLNGGGANNQAGNINQNYQTYQSQTNPLASNTNYDPMQTPGIGDQLGALRDSITQQVNGSFAAGGRDGSGYNQKALGQGLTAGLAPILTNQYNQNIQNQQGAASNLYNAGNTNAGLLAGLQQQSLANQGAGASQAGNDPVLAAEAARRGIPVQALGLLAQIGVPIAGLGGQSTGTSTGTQQASPTQQISSLLGGVGGFLGNFGTGRAFPSIFGGR